MNDTNRVTIDVFRHAEPVVDEVTKRSTNVITVPGAYDSISFGEKYKGVKNFSSYSTPEPRGIQTAYNINIGAQSTKLVKTMNDLGLDFTRVTGRQMPSGIPYGKKWIDTLLEDPQNVGIADDAAAEVFRFLAASFLNRYRTNEDKVKEDSTILGITHGPKMEISYGRLLGLPDKELGDLAAEPLGGFSLNIDTKFKSGIIDRVQINYTPKKGQTPQEGRFNTLDTQRVREYLRI